ncbi:scyllo-inositol 2-dehydrogenase (NAD(+)) [Vanrija pseudolonga]|uniref:Scyllo-inositol 2-dehydrogenase (NAD(+)) n=1 Tax=Vanrija pseudolonga TaxID=143232 RepID=A0AAF0Y7F4_9TREE|nr:scyllo-inositol 2-dehydrogenase (NAD(+)) [Vanrija pseudolonga]
MTVETPKAKLKVALFGVGRLGSIRARILTNFAPRIELVAVCDPKPGSDKWVAQNLPAHVKFFADPEDCLVNGGAQAVLISTATATHAPLVLRALDLDLHVMVEKPIAVDIETTRVVLEKAKTKPHLKFLVPFCRRFDESYRSLKTLVDSGDLGDIHAVQTDCLDKQDPSGFFVNFSEQSGGIFVDMGVHDIDIARFYLDVTKGCPNPRKQVNRVFAVGQTAVYHDLNNLKTRDCDNGWGVVEFSNGKVLNFHIGRTLTNGFESATRVFGTKGSAIVNNNSVIDRVEVRDGHGVRTATTPDAFVLYDKSFVHDLEEFANCVLDDKPLSLLADDALEAGKIATALQYSFRNNVPVLFDEEGNPVLRA